MTDLTIWLSGISLAEGIYRDFRVGQEVRFPLQLYPRTVVPATGSAGLERSKPGYYRFTARLIYLHDGVERGQNRAGETIERTETFWALDAGVHAYCLDWDHGRLPANAQEGSCWSGDASFCVAWHFFDRYSSLPGLPSMIYPWRVERIVADRTPWVTLKDARGEPHRGKDETRRAFSEVAETDRGAGPGNDYLITCALLGPPSLHRLEPASPSEERAVRSLPGTKVLVQPVETPDGRSRPETGGVTALLLQVSDQTTRLQRALLRLDCPFPDAPGAELYALAIPRYEDDGIRQIATGRRYSCWLRFLPADRDPTATPFDRLQERPGELLAAELSVL